MNFLVYDTASGETEACAAIHEAIAHVESRLQAEESRGRMVQQEDEGRWAIYGNEGIDLVWIEDLEGMVVPFIRNGAGSEH